MEIKVKDTKFTITDDGINFNGYDLILTLKNPNKTLDEIEEIFDGNTRSIKVFDGDTQINLIRGYTFLVMISKNVQTNDVSVTLLQPTLTIKGFSDREEVKRLIEKEGYEVDG